MFYFHPYLGKIPSLTIIFFKWVVQPPTRKIHKKKLEGGNFCLRSVRSFWLRIFFCWTKNHVQRNFRMNTLPETNSSPLKIGHPKRKSIFQPSIFRGELLVSGMNMLLKNLNHASNGSLTHLRCSIVTFFVFVGQGGQHAFQL